MAMWKALQTKSIPKKEQQHQQTIRQLNVKKDEMWKFHVYTYMFVIFSSTYIFAIFFAYVPFVYVNYKIFKINVFVATEKKIYC